MKLLTPMTDLATGRDAYAVWEYDADRPRNLGASDPRQRYAVKGFVGQFNSRLDAEIACG